MIIKGGGTVEEVGGEEKGRGSLENLFISAATKGELGYNDIYLKRLRKFTSSIEDPSLLSDEVIVEAFSIAKGGINKNEVFLEFLNKEVFPVRKAAKVLCDEVNCGLTGGEDFSGIELEFLEDVRNGVMMNARYFWRLLRGVPIEEEFLRCCFEVAEKNNIRGYLDYVRDYLFFDICESFVKVEDAGRLWDDFFKNMEGGSLLFRAVIWGRLDIIKCLRGRGVWRDLSVRMTDGSERGVLHLAVSRGDLELVSYLIGEGVDVNMRDFLNRTPLYLAIQNRQFDICGLLAERDRESFVPQERGIKFFDSDDDSEEYLIRHFSDDDSEKYLIRRFSV